MSDKKIGVKRRSMYSGSRRGKPKVRALNQAVIDRIKVEQEVFDALMRDAEVRRSQLASLGPADPLAVYEDFDQFRDWTEIDPTRLPEWRELGQYLKLQIITQIAVELGGFSFTVNVRRDLQDKWEAEGRDVLDRIRRLAREAIEHAGLTDLAFFYVIEGASRSGSSRTKLHLHGVLLTEDRLAATRFVVGMQTKLAMRPSGGGAQQRGRPVDMVPTYDKNAQKRQGKGRWASYVAKNIMKWDDRIAGRRVFVSWEATRTATEMWKLIRNED